MFFVAVAMLEHSFRQHASMRAKFGRRHTMATVKRIEPGLAFKVQLSIHSWGWLSE